MKCKSAFWIYSKSLGAADRTLNSSKAKKVLTSRQKSPLLSHEMPYASRQFQPLGNSRAVENPVTNPAPDSAVSCV